MIYAFGRKLALTHATEQAQPDIGCPCSPDDKNRGFKRAAIGTPHVRIHVADLSMDQPTPAHLGRRYGVHANDT